MTTPIPDILDELREAVDGMDWAALEGASIGVAQNLISRAADTIAALRRERDAGSVDAALALVEKRLPGAYGHVAFGSIPEACLYYNHGKATISSFGATPALALLSALSKAPT